MHKQDSEKGGAHPNLTYQIGIKLCIQARNVETIKKNEGVGNLGQSAFVFWEQAPPCLSGRPTCLNTVLSPCHVQSFSLSTKLHQHQIIPSLSTNEVTKTQTKKSLVLFPSFISTNHLPVYLPYVCLVLCCALVQSVQLRNPKNVNLGHLDFFLVMV